jgi:hypothetical protein
MDGRLMGKGYIGKDVEGNSRGLLEALFLSLSGVTDKTT